MKTKLIQHSKKLATASLTLYFILCFLCVALIFAVPLEDYQLRTIESIHGAAATLCGVIITGYMGNSGLEKYSDRKFNYKAALDIDSESENG